MRVIYIGLVLLLTGCATAFTETNIDKLRIGMTSTEVREIFGAPNEISTAVCGANTTSGSWVCETWKYRNSGSYQTNNFTFSVKTDVKTLNDWHVRR
jgi:hypothetical protein